MQQQGRITVRGPFRENEKDKYVALLKGHPFNTEASFFLPTIGSNKRKSGLEYGL